MDIDRTCLDCVHRDPKFIEECVLPVETLIHCYRPRPNKRWAQKNYKKYGYYIVDDQEARSCRFYEKIDSNTRNERVHL